MAFDDSKFKAGDEVASYIVIPLKGDRADIRVAIGWKDGMHTSVVSRKLVTGSKFDVQLGDLSKRYAVRLRRLRQRAGAARHRRRPAVPGLRQVISG